MSWPERCWRGGVRRGGLLTSPFGMFCDATRRYVWGGTRFAVASLTTEDAGEGIRVVGEGRNGDSCSMRKKVDIGQKRLRSVKHPGNQC